MTTPSCMNGLRVTRGANNREQSSRSLAGQQGAQALNQNDGACKLFAPERELSSINAGPGKAKGRSGTSLVNRFALSETASDTIYCACRQRLSDDA